MLFILEEFSAEWVVNSFNSSSLRAKKHAGLWPCMPMYKKHFVTWFLSHSQYLKSLIVKWSTVRPWFCLLVANYVGTAEQFYNLIFSRPCQIYIGDISNILRSTGSVKICFGRRQFSISSGNLNCNWNLISFKKRLIFVSLQHCAMGQVRVWILIKLPFKTCCIKVW